MENNKSSQKRFSLRQIPNFLKLYLIQLSLAIVVWGLNVFVFKQSVSEIIIKASDDFTPLVIYTEPWYQILIKSFFVITIIYVLLYVIGALTHFAISKTIYLILAVVVSFAAGTSFEGGILTNAWGNGVFQLLISQLEWFGGAMILSANTKNSIELRNFFLGIGSILTSVILRVLIF